MGDENKSFDNITKNYNIFKDISKIEQDNTNSYANNNNNESVQNNRKNSTQNEENYSIKINDSKETQSDFFNKRKIMEFLIDIIKQNSYNKMRDEIKIKLNEKFDLENNIKYYQEKINDIRAQKRNLNYFKNIINSEIKRIDNNKKIICRPENNCKDDLVKIKKEINTLVNQIKKAKENFEQNNAEISKVKNETLKNKDMIKRLNMVLRKQKVENENKENKIKLLNKHILLIKEKIEKENNKTKEFFLALTNLAINSKIPDDEVTFKSQKKIKRARSCNGYRKM